MKAWHHGFSLLEILVAVIILAMAILPIFSLATSTTRSAHLVGRHMTATQIGQSLLEWFVAQPYQDALREAGDLRDQTISIPDDLIFQTIVNRALEGDPAAILQQFNRTFSMMQYRVEAIEEDAPAHGKVARFRITLFYRLVEEGSPVQQTVISALKFPEDV